MNRQIFLLVIYQSLIYCPDGKPREEVNMDHELAKQPTSKTIFAQNIVVWILSLLVAFIFLRVGISKLISAPNMVEEFNRVGLGQWFRYFAGSLEVTGAIGLLVPKASRWGALLLMIVMVGAIITHLTVLNSSPVLPGSLLMFLTVIYWLRHSLHRYSKH